MPLLHLHIIEIYDACLVSNKISSDKPLGPGVFLGVRLLLQYLQKRSIFFHYQQAPQIRLLIFSNKESSSTLSLQNLAASVVETVICRQHSLLNGVDHGIYIKLYTIKSGWYIEYIEGTHVIISKNTV